MKTIRHLTFLLLSLCLLPILPGQVRGEIVAWGDNTAGQTTVPAGAQSGVSALAAGVKHTVALKSDGGVLAWGHNDRGQTTVPAEAQSGVTAIAAGGEHTLALKSDGSVLAWGNNDRGQTTVPAGAQSGVTAIAAGGEHSVALKSDGSVIAWGDGLNGETAVPAEALSGVIAIAAGYLHSVALKSDGSVLAWGYNALGQTTVPAGAQSGVTAIAAGSYYTMALKSDGSVIVWGAGLPTVPVGVQSGVVAIAAGSDHGVALKSDGSVLAWGFNGNGQTTVPAGAQSGVTALAGGGKHTVALKGGMPVAAWGDNSSGQTTVPAEAQSDVKAIAGGELFTVALKSDGRVLAWGEGSNGQTTVPAEALSGVMAIAAGAEHTVALKSDGLVLAWGRSGEDQTTVPAEAQSGAIAIAAGAYHTVALKSDGRVLVWGYNANGQTMVPTEALSGVTAIAGGELHTVALKSDGSVLAWGDNPAGQTTVPTEALSGVIAIAAGRLHTVALKSDGSVLAWGGNFFGQTTVPGGAQSGVIAIAAAANHTVALKSDGSVIAWGSDSGAGSIDVPPRAQSGVTAIAAGYRHTVALAPPPNTTPPETTITSTQPTPTNNTGATIAFTGSDDVTPAGSLHFEGRLVGNAFAAVTSPVTVSGLTNGSHTYEVRATDAVGHVDTSPASVTWTVDTVPPTLTLPGPITAMATSLAGVVVNYTASANDPSGIAASSFLPGTGSTFPLGTTTVNASATDNAGNTATGSFDVTVRLAAPVSTKLFAKGDGAPGRGVTPGLPADAVLASFGVPAINDDGNVAFLAKWTSLGPPASKGSGLFTSTACLGLVGGAVPGITGATYKSFTDPVMKDDAVACIATLSGTPKPPASVVLHSASAGGPLGVIARAGEEAPGADGSQTLGAARFKTFKVVQVQVRSETAIFAQLTGGTSEKVTAANDYGVWLMDYDSSLRRALREGEGEIKTLVTFAAGAGSPGQGRGWLAGTPMALGLSLRADKSQAVVGGRIGGALMFSQSGDVSTGPEIAGASFASYGLPAANVFFGTAFLASITIAPGIATKADARGIFVNYGQAGSGGSLKYTPVARVAHPAGTTGTTFSQLKDPVLAYHGLAFPATLKASATVKGLATATLWWTGGDGYTPELLAQGGARPGPDLPADAQWKAFTSLAVPIYRGPIFVATLVPGKGGVTAKSASGVWAMDFNNKLRTLFRTGDQIDVGAPGTPVVKTVKSFTLLNATVGSLGVTRSFNDNGQVVWLATFTDKTTAIITTEVP